MSHALFELLRKLDMTSVSYVLARYRPDSVTVTLTLVEERVEIDVFEDGHMEVSRFRGSEDSVGGAELVDELLEENRD